MDKALVALIGLVGVLQFSAVSVAHADEFLYQGGEEAFGGEPGVGMTMTGNAAEKPVKLTGFALSAFEWQGCPESNSPLVARFPLGRNLAATRTRRNEEGDLYFSWSYKRKKGVGGLDQTLWKVVGGQHRKNPRWWVGRVRIRLEQWKVTEHGYEQLGTCEISGADGDGFVDWKARLVKVCPEECRSPFASLAGMVSPFPPTSAIGLR